MALFTVIDIVVLKQQMQMLSIEANFEKNLLIVTTPVSCNNYEMGLNLSLKRDDKSVKILGSHLQVLFEYIKTENELYEFKFNPNLINSF